MLLNLGREEVAVQKRLLQIRAWVGPSVLAGVLLVELVVALSGDGITPGAGGTAGGMIPPREVGAALLGPYALAVEIVAMLLLAGLVAASHIGRTREPIPPTAVDAGARTEDADRDGAAPNGETPDRVAAGSAPDADGAAAPEPDLEPVARTGAGPEPGREETR
jgi:hypothetical protein